VAAIRKKIAADPGFWQTAAWKRRDRLGTIRDLFGHDPMQPGSEMCPDAAAAAVPEGAGERKLAAAPVGAADTPVAAQEAPAASAQRLCVCCDVKPRHSNRRHCKTCATWFDTCSNQTHARGGVSNFHTINAAMRAKGTSYFARAAWTEGSRADAVKRVFGADCWAPGGVLGPPAHATSSAPVKVEKGSGGVRATAVAAQRRITAGSKRLRSPSPGGSGDAEAAPAQRAAAKAARPSAAGAAAAAAPDAPPSAHASAPRAAAAGASADAGLISRTGRTPRNLPERQKLQLVPGSKTYAYTAAAQGTLPCTWCGADAEASGRGPRGMLKCGCCFRLQKMMQARACATGLRWSVAAANAAAQRKPAVFFQSNTWRARDGGSINALLGDDWLQPGKVFAAAQASATSAGQAGVKQEPCSSSPAVRAGAHRAPLERFRLLGPRCQCTLCQDFRRRSAATHEEEPPHAGGPQRAQAGREYQGQLAALRSEAAHGVGAAAHNCATAPAGAEPAPSQALKSSAEAALVPSEPARSAPGDAPGQATSGAPATSTSSSDMRSARKASSDGSASDGEAVSTDADADGAAAAALVGLAYSTALSDAAPAVPSAAQAPARLPR
jgi:hypothetical protein